MKEPTQPAAIDQEKAEVADRLHSLAVHLLRRLRRVDSESRLTGPRLSALSVVVFGGPITLSELATAEQVSRPTRTRLVQALEREGLLQRTQDPADARIARVAATPRGQRVMREGRERRVQMLSSLLQELPVGELKAVRKAILSLEPIVAAPPRKT